MEGTQGRNGLSKVLAKVQTRPKTRVFVRWHRQFKLSQPSKHSLSSPLSSYTLHYTSSIESDSLYHLILLGFGLIPE